MRRPRHLSISDALYVTEGGAHEMNICIVRGDWVSCWINSAASKRVSGECLFDVYGFLSAVTKLGSEQLTIMTWIPPTRQKDSSASRSRMTIYHQPWQLHRGVNIQY